MPDEELRTLGFHSAAPYHEFETWIAMALHVLLALSAATAFGPLLRTHGELRRPLQMACGAAVVFTLAWLVFNPMWIPLDLLTPLQEGSSEQDAYHLYGSGGHASFGFHSVSRLATDFLPSVHSLREMIAFNLWLWSLASLGFALWCHTWLRSVPLTIAFTAVFALNRIALNSVFSEAPAAYLGLLCMLGAAGGGLALRAEAQADRRAGFGLLAAATVAMLCARPETAMVGLTAMGSVWLGPRANLLIAPFVRIGRRLRGSVASGAGSQPLEARDSVAAPKTTDWILLAATIPLLVGWYWASTGPGSGRLQWLVTGAFPLESSIAYLPMVLGFAGLPLGVMLIIGAGVVRSVRDFRSFLWLPLSLLVLFRVYMSAGHDQYFEYLRYVGLWLPMLLLLLPVGWLRLGRWRRLALLLCLIPSPPAIAEIGESGFLIKRNQQREVQKLARLVDDNPDCAIGLMADLDRMHFGVEYRFSLIFIGEPLQEPATFLAMPGDILAEYDEHLGGVTSCVMVVRGLDCSLEGADCPDPGGKQLHHERWANLPYYEGHSGPHRDEIDFRVNVLRR